MVVVSVAVIEPVGGRRDQIPNNNQARPVSSNPPIPCPVQLLSRPQEITDLYASVSPSRNMESAVLQVLRETLSPDEGVRNHAEAQLKQLFTLPGASSQKPWKGLAHHGIDGGLSLARILSAQDVDLPQRQISRAPPLDFDTPSL